MNAVIGLLILCGTYSTHCASVSVPLSSPCSGQADGVLLPVHGKCSQFYICLNGKDVLQSCGAQLHFNAKNRQCIEASKSACVDEESHSSLESEIEEKPSVAQTNICSGKAIGSFLSSKTSCSDFYVCAGNKAILKSCQDKYHFDGVLNACIRAEMSKCVVTVDKPVEEAKPEMPVVTGPIGTTLFAETVCLGQPNGAKFAAPESCSKYFTCLQHKAYENTCGLRHFDPLARSCIDAKSSHCVEAGDAINDLAVEAAESAQAEIDLTNASTGADVGTPGKYIVVGGKLVKIKKTGLPVISKSSSPNEITPIEQLPVANPLEADVHNLDIVEITMDADGDLSTKDSGVDIGIVDEKTRADNKGIFVGSGNIDINNEGSVSNISVITSKGGKQRAGNTGIFFGSGNIDVNNKGSASDISVVNTKGEKERAGNKGVFFGNGNIDINNEGTVEGVSVINGHLDKAPEIESSENESEIVIAVIDESSKMQCVGVPSGGLLPKTGNCREFLTCEDGVAYVGQCPEGLHFNRALKICDWPELAGCA